MGLPFPDFKASEIGLNLGDLHINKYRIVSLNHGLCGIGHARMSDGGFHFDVSLVPTTARLLAITVSVTCRNEDLERGVLLEGRGHVLRTIMQLKVAVSE